MWDKVYLQCIYTCYVANGRYYYQGTKSIQTAVLTTKAKSIYEKMENKWDKWCTS